MKATQNSDIAPTSPLILRKISVLGETSPRFKTKGNN